MHIYHEPASAGNVFGLPKHTQMSLPNGLTSGGRLVYRRTHRPVETCNLLAQIAGIGSEVAK